MFWNTFVKLCNEKGFIPNPVAKSLGFSSGSVTSWKNGAIPHDTTLQKIADYFGVSADYLLKDEIVFEDANKVHDDYERKLLYSFRKLTVDGKL